MRTSCVALAAVCLLLPAPTSAEPWCEACAPDAKPIVIASSRDDRSEQRARRREEDRRDRRDRRERSDAQRTGRRKLYGLERQLRREERRERDASRRKHNPQAGALCMYGGDGKLIHAPRGAQCPATNDEAPGGAAAVPGAPVQSGCVGGDCRNGRGTFVWKSGSRYVGEFKNGKQHGQGSLAYSSGASYVGAWQEGKRAGTGTAVYPDGRVEGGRWVDNKLVEAGAGSVTQVAITWPDLSKPAPKIGGGKHDSAIVVGVENYAHVGRIPGATQNATDWYKYLVKSRGIPTDRVTLLLDEDATREEMLIAVESAAKDVGRKGSLWFVFVGHGAAAADGKDGLLIGFDAQQRARSISARSLRRAELIAALEGSRAAHVNVLLDACFSGRQQNGQQLVAGLQPLVVTSETPTSDPRITLMTAARSDQYAGPLPGASRPAFSYLMLGGLRGWADLDNDGRVVAGELHEYVSDTMRSLIRGRSQNPTLTGGTDVLLVKSARETGPDIADLVVRSAKPASRVR